MAITLSVEAKNNGFLTLRGVNGSGVGQADTLLTNGVTNLYLMAKYTKGTETDVGIGVTVQCPDYAMDYNLITAADPITKFQARLAATGNYCIPIPVPEFARGLIFTFTPSNGAAATGTLQVGLQGQTGLVAPVVYSQR